MARSRPRFYLRKFLNKPTHHTVASVLMSVTQGSITCSISDCDRTIKLDFNGYRPIDRKNSLYKVNELISAFTQLRDAMTAEFEARRPDRDDDY